MYTFHGFSVGNWKQEIPSTGVECWYKLGGRSQRSTIQGRIHLKLWLSTREDLGTSEEDNWTEIKQQEKLHCVFIDFEVSRFKVSSSTTFIKDIWYLTCSLRILWALLYDMLLYTQFSLDMVQKERWEVVSFITKSRLNIKRETDRETDDSTRQIQGRETYSAIHDVRLFLCSKEKSI